MKKIILALLIGLTLTLSGLAMAQSGPYSAQIQSALRSFRANPQTFTANVAATSVRGTAVLFANVPATPVEGMLVAITDSTTAVWGNTITGTGANHVLAYYNGTNWTVAGK